ncbi:MAG: DUF3097 family protein [Acidimicrobiia bacterium]|nr:DUF3097 family protein [Acidimicrobiia bacterium]
MPANDRWDEGDVLENSKKSQYPEMEAEPGLELTHTGSGKHGVVSGFNQGDKVVLTDESGNRHVFRAHDGAFTHKGRRVALRTPEFRPPARRFTASGSIAAPTRPARTARASRIWVEGIHDAELIEKVWGDDLREVGVVVEPLHGADDLASAVQDFTPGPERRVGILLDHLVEASKESRIAKSVTSPHVLICGHHYVDIWEAIKPGTIGIEAWPSVPKGQPWKEGIVAALNLDVPPGVFWGKVLGEVGSYLDLETPLVNAVERLIDFVTVE